MDLATLIFLRTMVANQRLAAGAPDVVEAAQQCKDAIDQLNEAILALQGVEASE